MTYQTFQEFNQTGLSGMFLYSAEVVPIFIPLLLFSFFTIILLATFFSTKRFGGEGDFMASFAVAGYATLVLGIVMSLVGGLVDGVTLSIVFGVAIIGTILLLVGRER